MESAHPTALTLCTRHTPLAHLPSARAPCPRCGRAQHHYCGKCLTTCIPPGSPPLPRVALPLVVHVLRGKEESDAKSTAAHLAVLAPDAVTVWRLPAFPPIADPRRVLLLYPSPASVPISSLDASDFDALIVVDTTWQRAGGVLQLPQLGAPFVHVHLGGRGAPPPHTLFWRHQPLGPACLSTAEATYYAFRELEKEYGAGGAKGGKRFHRAMRPGYVAAEGVGEEGGAEDDTPRGVSSNATNRKRGPHVKAGWTVRSDLLAADAASVKMGASTRFEGGRCEGHAGGATSDTAVTGAEAHMFARLANMRHEYAVRPGVVAAAAAGKKRDGEEGSQESAEGATGGS